MRFTDREQILEITMRLWDGTRWGQDISGEMLSEPGMQRSEALDAWIVDDVMDVIEHVKSWKEGTGDFFGCGAGEEDDYFFTVKDVIEDYDQTAASLYDGGWRAEDRDDIKDEYDFTDAQVDRICEKLAEYAAQ